MTNRPTSTQQPNRLQDKVTLIINGICESGRVLAAMLARQGSDVAIVDFHGAPALAGRIRREVEAIGRRCLIVMPEMETKAHSNRPFAQQAMQKIIDHFGRLDILISYSAQANASLQKAASEPGQEPTGAARTPEVLDGSGLTKAALKHILKHDTA